MKLGRANLSFPMSKTKQLLFWALTALLIGAAVELGATLLLALTSGRWPSDVAAAQRSVLEGKPAGGIDDDAPQGYARQAIHPFLGYTADPGAVDGATEAARFGFPHNAGGRLFFEPDPERLVVALLGGSVARSTASAAAGLAAELAKVDRFDRREIVVISLADGGVKQPQQLMTLAWFLALGAHFDLVVNLDGFNEVALPAAELVPRRVFPFYPRAWDQRVGPFDGELRRQAGELAFHRRRRRDLARRFSAWPWRASPTGALLWRAADARAQRQIAHHELELLAARSATSSPTARGPERAYASRAEMFEDLARFWHQASLQMHHLCRGQGIEYHHFLQPNQYLPGSKPTAAERESGTWSEDHPHRAAVEEGYGWLRRFGRELEGEGVGFHDLTQIFNRRQELLYADSCCHLNALGNVLLQRAVARRLAAGTFDRPENLSDGALALEGYDPVAYFDGRAARGQGDLEAVWDGVRYRFSSPGNRTRFAADPERFVPRYGGWCAYGMGMDEGSVGLARERYPVDPESFEVAGDKLYLFFRTPSFDARERWLADRERIRGRAAATWERLRRE